MFIWPVNLITLLEAKIYLFKKGSPEMVFVVLYSFRGNKVNEESACSRPLRAQVRGDSQCTQRRGCEAVVGQTGPPPGHGGDCRATVVAAVGLRRGRCLSRET